MNISAKTDKPESDIQVRLMLPQDAPGVVGLYTAVYGTEYPVKTVYDPEAITRQQENGDMYRIIAVNGDRVVGQTAVYRSTSTNPKLYEEGQGIVLPECRNQGILELCMGYGHQDIYPRLNIDQMWGEAVCNHVFMQRASARLGAFETGIELDLMPASSYVKEQSSNGRVSALLMFKTVKPSAQTIYIPESYNESIRYLYSVYDSGHQFISSNATLPDQATYGHQEVYAGAGVARFTILEAGKDLVQYLQDQEKEALAQDCCVLQVYLSLGSPSVGHAVSILRENKYFIGGILPCWFGTDGLLMQKLLYEPSLDGIKLYSQRAENILKMIIDDGNSVSK